MRGLLHFEARLERTLFAQRASWLLGFWLCAIWLCAIWLCASPVIAQQLPEPVPETPTPSATEPSAPELAPPAQTPAQTPAPPAQTSPPERPEHAHARSVVARAEELFEVGDYSAALAEYSRAYELLEGDPRQASVLNNIAVCHERMFRYDLALTFYERYLNEHASSADDRQEVLSAMQSLREVLGTVQVSASARADIRIAPEVWIDNRHVGTAPLSLQIPAGVHVLELRAKGYEPVRLELRVTARGSEEVRVTLEPLPSYRGLHPAFFFAGAGLTAAALITGSVLGIAALNEHAEGEEQVERGLIVDGEPAKDLALGADVAFGVGLAFAVGTSVLFFLTNWDGAPESERAQASPPVRLSLAPKAAALTLEGNLP
jgi:tetratricopeptide (TPR) repeat protein